MVDVAAPAASSSTNGSVASIARSDWFVVPSQHLINNTSSAPHQLVIFYHLNTKKL
jgi:hypothetical protein